VLDVMTKINTDLALTMESSKGFLLEFYEYCVLHKCRLGKILHFDAFVAIIYGMDMGCSSIRYASPRTLDKDDMSNLMADCAYYTDVENFEKAEIGTDGTVLLQWPEEPPFVNGGTLLLYWKFLKTHKLSYDNDPNHEMRAYRILIKAIIIARILGSTDYSFPIPLKYWPDMLQWIKLLGAPKCNYTGKDGIIVFFHIDWKEREPGHYIMVPM